MLLSTREMGLGDEHDGIAELPEGTPTGLPYASWAGLDDPVIEIGVTPNRGDALSVRGIARDLAACGLGRLKHWEPAAVPAAFKTPIGWDVAWPAACPWILGRSIRGVKNGPSPGWLQRRLSAIGLRPINALVDITNFFTFDIGRPLHVFDADRIAGTTLALRPGHGEVFRALNGRDVAVTPDDLVIADAGNVVSLAGIMGGEATGSSLETTHVFVECALFDPVRIALSGRRLGLSSDARQRFERGLDQALLPRAIEAATAMILDLCGGEAGSVVSAGAEPAWQRTARLRFERLAGLGGAEMLPEEALNILRRLGFGPVAQDSLSVTVAVPPWRNDIAGGAPPDQAPTLDAGVAQTALEGAAAMEPECDLLEEVLRIRGLDLIAPVSLPQKHAIPVATITPRQSRAMLARRVLASRGLAECVTYSFGARADLAPFGEVPDQLRLKNPIAADLDQMRPTPLATLAHAARRNFSRGACAIGLFEVGPGYTAGGEVQVAAGLRVGALPRHWQGMPEFADAMAAKADAFALLARLGVPLESLSVTPDAPGAYHPGQSGTVRQGPKTLLARFGALHPNLLAALDLAAPGAGFEIYLDSIPDQKRRRRAPPDLPPFQSVSRDFAFVVAENVAAETILRAARSAERALILRVGLFDAYAGENVHAGEKSIGVEVVFQPRERTLTDQDIESACAKVVHAVVKATGARLR
jgi:phenylalanyl-tRNA synthetase beta chain